MRWPWDSTTPESEAAGSESFMLVDRGTPCGPPRNEWEQRYDALQARYDALLEKYHALKLQGAVAVEPQAPVARKEVDLVVQRINVLSAGKPGLRAAMLNQLSDDRLLRGLGDIEILQRIEAGVTTDDGVMA